MVEPGATFCWTNAFRVMLLKSGMTAIRTRPEALPLLYGSYDESRFSAFQLTATPQTCLSPANPRIVQLHFTASRLTFLVNHRSAELVEHHPGRLVTSQTKLTLQKKRRDAALTCLCGILFYAIGFAFMFSHGKIFQYKLDNIIRIRNYAAARRFAPFSCCLGDTFCVPLVAFFDFTFAANSCLTCAETASTSTL